MPRDGNCLFKSIAAHWSEGDHRELRRRVVRWLRVHKDGRENETYYRLNIPQFWVGLALHLDSLCPVMRMLTEQYLDYIARDMNWGGMVEILASDHILVRTLSF